MRQMSLDGDHSKQSNALVFIALFAPTALTLFLAFRAAVVAARVVVAVDFILQLQ